MNQTRKQLLLCLGVPLGAGALAALISIGGMLAFPSLDHPPLTPPGWLFPAAWTVLYLMMGWASFLVLRSGRPQPEIQGALGRYGAQLALNFLWPILFFALAWRWAALLCLLMLWGLIAVTATAFYAARRPAGLLLLPYLGWVSFAVYLNVGVALLN